MRKIDDGGQAFPMVDALNEISYGGMSLRDYFAAQSLAGIRTITVSESSEWAAKLAYKDADALLAARAAGDADEA